MGFEEAEEAGVEDDVVGDIRAEAFQDGGDGGREGGKVG